MKWEKRPIGEVCQVIAGGTPSRSKPQFWGGSIPWVKISDMLQGTIFSTEECITEKGLEESTAKVLPAGTILISIFATIGRTATLGVDATTNQAIVGVVPKKAGTFYGPFLRYCLEDRAAHLKSLSRGVAQANINGSVLKQTEIPLPPLAEQKRIAGILDAADALRAKRREALAQLDTLLQATFLDLFGEKVETISIGEMLERGILLLHKDGNHGSLYPRAEEFGSTGIPFLSAKCISENGDMLSDEVQFLSESKARKLKLGWIESGDVLLAHNASVGKTLGYQGEFAEALIGTSLTAFRANREFLDPAYLLGALRSQDFQQQLSANMGQTTRNQVPITAQRRLTLSLPPLERQKRFASIGKSIEDQRKVAGRHLAELDLLFASLQSRAFRGEL